MQRKARSVGLWALLAVAVFGSLVGLHIARGEAGLSLELRPVAVAVLVAAVAAARLAIGGRTIAPTRVARRTARALSPALLGAAILLPFLGNRYAVDTGTLVLIYIMLAAGLNIVVGLAGLLDLGYVAFYAVGAYAYAIMSTRWGVGFWAALPVCGMLAAAAGVVLGFPVLRLRGDYLAIVTLGFGEIIRIVVNNWTQLTRGPQGIADIPRPTLFGLGLGGNGPGTLGRALGLHATPVWRVIFLYYLILAMALSTAWIGARLRQLPIGRAWEALREDEIACRSIGIDPTLVKLAAFATGAFFAGLAGAFFAARSAFVSPESFVFMESATVLAIVVLGGLGSQTGIAVAAIVMIGGGEVLRELLLDASQRVAWAGDVAGDIGQYRMLVFGAAMIAVMVWRPRGFAARKPSLLLGSRH